MNPLFSSSPAKTSLKPSIAAARKARPCSSDVLHEFQNTLLITLLSVGPSLARTHQVTSDLRKSSSILPHLQSRYRGWPERSNVQNRDAIRRCRFGTMRWAFSKLGNGTADDASRRHLKSHALIIGLFIGLLLVSLAASWSAIDVVNITRAYATGVVRYSKAA